MPNNLYWIRLEYEFIVLLLLNDGAATSYWNSICWVIYMTCTEEWGDGGSVPLAGSRRLELSQTLEDLQFVWNTVKRCFIFLQNSTVIYYYLIVLWYLHISLQHYYDVTIKKYFCHSERLKDINYKSETLFVIYTKRWRTVRNDILNIARRFFFGNSRTQLFLAH